MLPALPTVDDPEQYQRLWAEDAPWLPFVEAIARSRGYAGPIERYRSGTAVAFRLGDEVLKIYPPIAAGDADVEAHVLAALAAQPEVPSPRLVARGRQGDWSHVVMSRLSGVPIELHFAARPEAERRALAHGVGQMVRALHRLSGADIPRLDPDFRAFRERRRTQAVQHHVGRGFAAERAEELAAYLTELDREPELDAPDVLLHTELGPGHVLVEGGAVCGVFDFAEARSGPPEYDFAAVGLFVTAGDRAAFAAFLDGYGVPAAQRGAPLVRRLMRHALLHEYGHLSFYLRVSPVPNGGDLHALAAHWFGHEP